MFAKITWTSMAAVGMMLAGASDARAELPFRLSFNIGPQGPQVAIGPSGPSFHNPWGGHHYHVQYRQVLWQEREFDCMTDAHEFASYKRSQGYDAQVFGHGSHVNVRYRLLHWQTYRTVTNHAYAHQLEHSLEVRGFDARIIHR